MQPDVGKRWAAEARATPTVIEGREAMPKTLVYCFSFWTVSILYKYMCDVNDILFCIYVICAYKNIVPCT